MRELAKCLAAALSLLGCTPAEALAYEFGIGGKPLICVPDDIVPDYNQSVTHSSLALVAEAGVPLDLFTFNFFEPEISRKVPGFALHPGYQTDDSPNSIFGSVDLIPENHILISPGADTGPAVRIWNRTPPCSQPVIVRVPNSYTYLAKCDREDFWHVLFNRRPGSVQHPVNVYETVLARCTHTSVGFGPHKGAELEDCIRAITYKRFLIEYHFDVMNAGVIPKIDAFMRAEIDFWSRRCSKGQKNDDPG